MRYLLLALIAGLPVLAADPETPPKTQMTVAGKSVFADPLTGPLDGSWKVAKGNWETASNAIKGMELKEDMHGAVMRQNVTFKDAVISYSFKLDGAKSISLSLNGAKGHICRVAITPSGFKVNKDDQDGKNGPDKGETLGTCDTPIKAGEWHTLVLELRGNEMLATLDGKHTAYGKHDAIDKEKANIGLTVAGESASFKEISVWSGSPNPDWEKNREKFQKK